MKKIQYIQPRVEMFAMPAAPLMAPGSPTNGTMDPAPRRRDSVF